MAAGQRGSKIIPGLEDVPIEGLQYRRGSRKLSFPTITNEIKPSKLQEVDDDECSLEQLVPYAPDGGYGWLIVFASFLCNFVLDGISVSQATLMSHIQNASGEVNSTLLSPSVVESLVKEPQYAISVGLYNVIPSVLLSVTLSVGPFISLLTDRFGFRVVSICGSVLSALGIFLSWAISPSVPNIWVMVTFFGVLSGVGFGMMFQPSVVIVGIYFQKWRPLATGIAIAGTGVGTFAFPPLLEAVANVWGWQGAYLVQAGIALFSALFALIYIPLPKKRIKVSLQASESHERRPSFPGAEPTAETFRLESIWNGMKPTSVLKSMWRTMGPLTTSPTFLLISISGAITMLGFFAPYAFLSDYAEKELGMDRTDAIYLMSIIGIANTVGRLIFGLISSHPSVNSLILSNGALTVAGLATICVPFATAYYQLVLYSIIFGFGIAIFTVLRSILVLKFMGMEKFNNAFGLSLLFMGIGTAVGNPIGGTLKDSTGKYDISFYAAGCYLLLSGLMTYPLQHISDWENKREGSKENTNNVHPSIRKSLVL